MVRNRCIRSFAVSSILISVIIVFQLLFFEDTTSDAEGFLRENNVIVTDGGAEHVWNHRTVIESVSLICPNCTFSNTSSINRTSANDTEHMNNALYRYLRKYVRQLNQAPAVRNLDKFDMHADSEGSLVIVVQVRSCPFVAYLIV